MIELLLFLLASAQAAVVALLLVRTPLQGLAIVGIDGLKGGRWSGTIWTSVAGAVVASLVFWRTTHSLEAFLLGLSMFLSLTIIGQVHQCVRENLTMRKSMKAIMKQNRALAGEKSTRTEEATAREKEIANLKLRMAELELEADRRTKEVRAAEDNAAALRKQSEGFLLEYDRLQAINEGLRRQLQNVDRNLTRSESRKLW